MERLTELYDYVYSLPWIDEFIFLAVIAVSFFLIFEVRWGKPEKRGNTLIVNGNGNNIKQVNGQILDELD